MAAKEQKLPWPDNDEDAPNIQKVARPEEAVSWVSPHRRKNTIEVSKAIEKLLKSYHRDKERYSRRKEDNFEHNEIRSNPIWECGRAYRELTNLRGTRDEGRQRQYPLMVLPQVGHGVHKMETSNGRLLSSRPFPLGSDLLIIVRRSDHSARMLLRLLYN